MTDGYKIMFQVVVKLALCVGHTRKEAASDCLSQTIPLTNC